MNKVNLRTERLIIKPLTLNETKSFFEYRSLDEVARFQTFKPKNVGEAIAFIQLTSSKPNIPNSWYQLGMFDKDRGNLIGDIGIHFLNSQYETEIGCSLSPEYWGKGFASEGLSAVIAMIFQTLKKERVFANIDTNNSRSLKLFERLGFKLISENNCDATYQLVKNY
jgi:RimJ/RimL family protein N-acetyltransferase